MNTPATSIFKDPNVNKHLIYIPEKGNSSKPLLNNHDIYVIFPAKKPPNNMHCLIKRLQIQTIH